MFPAIIARLSARRRASALLTMQFNFTRDRGTAAISATVVSAVFDPFFILEFFRSRLPPSPCSPPGARLSVLASLHRPAAGSYREWVSGLGDDTAPSHDERRASDQHRGGGGAALWAHSSRAPRGTGRDCGDAGRGKRCCGRVPNSETFRGASRSEQGEKGMRSSTFASPKKQPSLRRPFALRSSPERRDGLA